MASPLAKDHYVLASSSFPFLLLHKLNRRGSVGMDDGKKRKLETPIDKGNCSNKTKSSCNYAKVGIRFSHPEST